MEITRSPLSSLALLACIVLAGCASPADRSAMVPANVSLGKKFAKSVSVGVTGGQETNPMFASQVANADFQAALEMTIERHGLFSRVIRGSAGDYQLDVRLIQLRQPMMGFDLTVEAQTEWRLRHAASERVVWQENINRAHTAKMGEAFAAIKRLRLANEGAIRENIKAGLERVSTLSL